MSWSQTTEKSFFRTQVQIILSNSACKFIRNAPFFRPQQSSVCRAGLHAGVIDNDGGWMDVTRQGRKDFFIKSNKNGVQSVG